MLRLGALSGWGSHAAAYLPAVPMRRAADETVPLAKSIASAAIKFLDSLDSGARTKATYGFADSERLRWHWTTPSGFPRNGLPLREMNDQQKELALTLLRTSISEAGYK